MFSGFNHTLFPDISYSLGILPDFLFPEMCLAAPSGLYHTWREDGHTLQAFHALVPPVFVVRDRDGWCFVCFPWHVLLGKAFSLSCFPFRRARKNGLAEKEGGEGHMGEFWSPGPWLEILSGRRK